MTAISSVDIVGAGPAGLYAAILLRRHLPGIRVRLFEQDPQAATFGFGVVFSDAALDFLRADDPGMYALIVPAMECWRNMKLNLPRGSVTLDGVGFSAIGRLELIEILRKRAQSLEIDITFNRPIEHLDELDADLRIGADGLDSLVRRSLEPEFRPVIEYCNNHFAWFGTPRSFDTLTQTFVDTGKGVFNAHHYRFAPGRSTFIIETDDATFNAYGLGGMPEDETGSLCEAIFAEVLDGAPLIRNKSHWRRFPRLWCENWYSGRFALLGDAAHTAHFSIGSGTRLAMEDAIALVRALGGDGDLETALGNFQAERQPIVRKFCDAAANSATWYDSFASRLNKQPLDFAFDYVMRSGRVDLNRLRKLAPDFMARYEAAKAADP